MAVLTWIVLVGVMLGVSWTAAYYLVRLPYAPECPACRGVTAEPARATSVDRLMAQYGGAATRNCPRCGWSGRMRWRLAEERAPK